MVYILQTGYLHVYTIRDVLIKKTVGQYDASYTYVHRDKQIGYDNNNNAQKENKNEIDTSY